MTKKIIGGILIASPFVVMFIVVTIKASILVALGIYTVVGVVLAVITAGVMLIWGEQDVL
jgi:hypothetical protein